MSLQVGLTTPLADPEAIIKRCQDLDVDQVTLRVASMPGSRELGHPEPKAFQQLHERLAEAGITVAAMSQWIGDFADLAMNPHAHRRHLDAALMTLQLQGQMGIERQLHYVDLPEPANPDDDEHMWNGMIQIYRELVAQAEASRVKLANHGIWRCLTPQMRDEAVKEGVTETQYRQYRKPGWAGPYLVRTAEHVRRIIDSVPSKHNGAALCTGMYITGADPASEAANFAGRINYVQIRDLRGRWPAALEVFPGTGDLDFKAILEALIKAGYSGFLHPEHLGQPRHRNDDPEKDATMLLKQWVADAETKPETP